MYPTHMSTFCIIYSARYKSRILLAHHNSWRKYRPQLEKKYAMTCYSLRAFTWYKFCFSYNYSRWSCAHKKRLSRAERKPIDRRMDKPYCHGDKDVSNTRATCCRCLASSCWRKNSWREFLQLPALVSHGPWFQPTYADRYLYQHV